MNRRGFVTVLGGAAATWPLRGHAQTALPVIGYLSGRSKATDDHLVSAFRKGLQEMGYVEGRNVAMDIRWADGHFDRVPAMMAELVETRPAVIVAVGGNQLGLAAKAATSTIPVVFINGADPVAIGLVTSLGRPEANLTGMTLLAAALDAKRLELLREMMPAARSLAFLFNPSNPGAATQRSESEAAAKTLRFDFRILEARNEAEIDQAFETLKATPVDALAVTVDAFLIGQRKRIVAATAARGLPAIFPAREFTAAGGLASYAPPWEGVYEGAGRYAGRILKGARPGDLPVQRPTRFELVVNLKTAKALGLTFPPAFLGRADELIE